MGVLNSKTINDFAKMINNSAKVSNNDYSMLGTVKSVGSDEVATDSGTTETHYYANVLLDGGNEDNLCVATYNGVICDVNDRVVVTIKDNVATVTENYTNPNGNTMYTTESGLQEFYFTNNGVRSKAVVTFSLPIEDGYQITGLKGIELWVYIERPAQYGESGWFCISDDVEGESGEDTIAYAGRIHLTSYNMTSNQITLTFGSVQKEGSSTKFRVKVTYVCISSNNLRSITIEEENNGSN